MSKRPIVDNDIKISNADRKYIGNEFNSNSYGKFKVLGIHSIGRRHTKKYICEFSDGLAVAEGGQIRNGSVKPKYKPYEKAEVNDIYKSDETKANDELSSLNKENKKLRKSVQSYQDKLRILRKENRSEDRCENVANTFMESIYLLIDNYQEPNKIEYIKSYNEKVALMQFSDHHIGQDINLKSNKYNLDIARERLFNYVNTSINEYIEPLCINKIHISFTGDFFNLDDRLDQLLTNQYVRAESFIRGFDLYCEVIDHILELGYSVDISSIVGNESRIKTDKKMSNVDSVAKDNFDYMLHQMLKRRYSEYVKFHNECDELESIVKVGDKNIILVHGNNFSNDIKKSVNLLRQRWFESNKVWADYVIFGHIHEPLISSSYARSGSLCGGNSYSDKGLNIPFSSISQNLYIIGDRIDGMVIDCK